METLRGLEQFTHERRELLWGFFYNKPRNDFQGRTVVPEHGLSAE